MITVANISKVDHTVYDGVRAIVCSLDYWGKIE